MLNFCLLSCLGRRQCQSPSPLFHFRPFSSTLFLSPGQTKRDEKETHIYTHNYLFFGGLFLPICVCQPSLTHFYQTFAISNGVLVGWSLRKNRGQKMRQMNSVGYCLFFEPRFFKESWFYQLPGELKFATVSCLTQEQSERELHLQRYSQSLLDLGWRYCEYSHGLKIRDKTLQTIWNILLALYYEWKSYALEDLVFELFEFRNI